ncbi:hypothetical protein FZI93_09575 [Mycobacterium sp. CBMA361]|nr:hypothetical protein [Mycolicibacterium sp. CBMA 213]MUM32052.1 hypothetical protein [Mycolicibacterium sp. CBMA 361]
MASAVAQCICSHPQTDHTDGLGRCHEPSGQCACEGFILLCPDCKHGRYSHNGTNDICTRKLQKTGSPCGCRYFTHN